MSKRTITYSRVSSTDQADQGYSLPSQQALCRQYAERLGYHIVAELAEDVSGATRISERLRGKMLDKMIREHQTEAVVVFQVDRLSRDIVDLLTMVQSWIRSGVEVHTCDIGKIVSELDIVLLIRGWQGSDERKRILERTMRGKLAKAELGKVIGCGHSPYGYSYLRDNKGKVVSFGIVEEEARIIRLIYKWYVSGDDSGHRLSATKIAACLSEMRVPTPGEAHGGYRRKRGAGMWNTHGIVTMISNELYTGVWRFNWRMGKTKTKRPLEQTFAMDIPPIVSRDIFALPTEEKTLRGKTHAGSTPWPQRSRHHRGVNGNRTLVFYSQSTPASMFMLAEGRRRRVLRAKPNKVQQLETSSR